MHDLFHERRYLIPFRGSLLPQIFCDTLVIGTGIAGLRAALAAGEHGEVIILAKSEFDRSSTSWAQGGIAAVSGDADDLTAHMNDTIEAGAGLCDQNAVHDAVHGAEARMQELCAWGARFDRDESGRIALGREGAHRRVRIWHCDGDATGRELIRVLADRVLAHPAIRLFEHCFALDLITTATDEAAPVLGAVSHHPRYGLQMIWASATILATGGAGQLYRETSNPTIATGDGLAMAYRAGAAVADMAFIQFHPTTLYIAGAERSLISEAVRGEGAYLVDRRGERFMADAHEMAELAPRDIVSRCIRNHLARTGETNVFIDARHFPAGFFAKRFPGIAQQLARFEIDPQQHLIPVHPAAHYTIGGVWVDRDGRTNLPGLYACGEVACTGLHGANRLASNSLLEGLVFGWRAGCVCEECRPAQSEVVPESDRGLGAARRIISDIPISNRGELDLPDVRSSLRSVMWRHLGVVRERAAMADVRDMIDFWARYTLDKILDEPAGWETQNMLVVASLICDSASWRKESRGTHARDDFAQPRDQFRCHDLWLRHGIQPRTLPVADPAPPLQAQTDSPTAATPQTTGGTK